MLTQGLHIAIPFNSSTNTEHGQFLQGLNVGNDGINVGDFLL